jgi:hypothetical protein
MFPEPWVDWSIVREIGKLVRSLTGTEILENVFTERGRCLAMEADVSGESRSCQLVFLRADNVRGTSYSILNIEQGFLLRVSSVSWRFTVQWFSFWSLAYQVLMPE